MSEHRMHTRQRQRRLTVDAADEGVGMRAAHKGRLQHAGKMNVVDETAMAAKEIGVFQAANVFAERLCAQDARPSALNRFAASSAAMTMF